MNCSRVVISRFEVAVLLFCFATSAEVDVWADSPTIQIATFQCDITPPTGVPIGMGFIKVLETVEHPLLAKGVVIVNQHGKQPQTYVLCGLDWMELHNSSYDELRQRIAESAGTVPSFVATHSLHQHTAPAFSVDVQRLRFAEDHPRRVATARYLDRTARDIGAAIQAALQDLRTLTHVGTSQAQVDRVASNRRIEKPDGTIVMRGSRCSTEWLRAAPEGLIDPWLKTVSFFSGKEVIARMHYYATHPQSFYNDGRISYDTCGIARERLQETEGVFQIYFTGCGGDIAMGKYNDGSLEARAELTDRLYNAMSQSVADVERTSVDKIRWDVAPFRFPPRTEEAFALETSRSKLKESLTAPTNVAWIERMQAGHAIELSCLTINNVQILHLPGEPFVLYQLAAQRSRPDSFVAVAGYGDGGVGYVGGDRIYTDRGGYEQTYCFTGPCEDLLNNAVSALLARGAE